MNIYDTKGLFCANCKKFIGEIDWDAKIINPLCGKCADPVPEGDKILYTVSHYQSLPKNKIIPLVTTA